MCIMIHMCDQCWQIRFSKYVNKDLLAPWENSLIASLFLLDQS